MTLLRPQPLTKVGFAPFGEVIETEGKSPLHINQGFALRFDDLRSAEAWGVTPDQAARRLHVRHQGQLVSGVPAFQILWSRLSGWRWLARFTALPIVHQIACALYDHVLAPILYRAHLRRQRRKSGGQ